MEMLLEVAVMLVIRWRVGLVTLLSVLAAVFLADLIPWFSGWYGTLLVIFSFGGGLLWDASASRAN